MKNDEELFGYNTFQLKISKTDLDDSGNYQCIIKDSVANVIKSKICVVNVSEIIKELAFTKDLEENISLKEGEKLSMSVVVTGGVPPYKYVWTKDGNVIEAAVTDTYEEDRVDKDDAGSYQVTVTDSQSNTLKSLTT